MRKKIRPRQTDETDFAPRSPFEFDQGPTFVRRRSLSPPLTLRLWYRQQGLHQALSESYGIGIRY